MLVSVRLVQVTNTEFNVCSVKNTLMCVCMAQLLRKKKTVLIQTDIKLMHPTCPTTMYQVHHNRQLYCHSLNKLHITHYDSCTTTWSTCTFLESRCLSTTSGTPSRKNSSTALFPLRENKRDLFFNKPYAAAVGRRDTVN